MTDAKDVKGTGARPRRSIRSIRSYMTGGLFITALLFTGIGGWAARTEISGAVIASGVVVVETNLKKVQHPTGGVVGEILIKNGDKVAAGDLLIRLDETVTRANLQVVSKQLDEVSAHAARLEAERDGLDVVPMPALFAGREAEESVVRMMAGERTLFTSRRESREGQKNQLRERVNQIKEQIEGINQQIEAKGKEIAFMDEELEALGHLEKQQLVNISRMVALRRDAARLEGDYGQYRAEAAKAKEQISEIELQVLRIDQDFRTEVMTDLREAQGKIGELFERKVAALDQLKRVEIRAPQAGTIHQLSVFTVGGVVNPGEPIMMIVPESDRLLIEARIPPHEIDQARSSTQALLRFTALDHRTTPEVLGDVLGISAERSTDQHTGEQYFVARLAMKDEERAKLGDSKLIPGMPVDVQIKTHDRTALSYILKPLQDQFAKAFKER